MNTYLNRINQLFYDLINTKKVLFHEDKWFKRETQDCEWTEMKIYTGNQVGIAHSKGKTVALVHLKLLMEHPGPYSLEQLVGFMYDGIFHKYYGWVKDFWDDGTLRMYFLKLKEESEPLYEVYIKENHSAFYKATQRMYKVKESYRSFLLDMGEDPEKINRTPNIKKFLRQGKDIEFTVINILKDINAPFEYFRRFDTGSIPDIYLKDSHEVIDIKRSIKTEITKETNKYGSEFTNVTIIYLLGSREMVINEGNIKKMSIYRWLQHQPFFKCLDTIQQSEIIGKLDHTVKNIDENQFNSDVNEYHKMLVEQIIKYDKEGLDNPKIAKKVNVSYKYVNLILQGKSLAEYSGTYPLIYKEKQRLKKQQIKKNTKKIVDLFHQGFTKKEISKQLRISVEMINYYLRSVNIHQKNILKSRNDKIHKMLIKSTNHETLANKFEWITEELVIEHPEITPSIVKNYYYSNTNLSKNDEKNIKGKMDFSLQTTKLYREGMNPSDIAENLNLSVQVVRSILRKSGLGRNDRLKIRNQRIEMCLKKYEGISSLKERFKKIEVELMNEYPTLTYKKIRVYYYSHYKKQAK